MRICIFGTGYVGLVTGSCFADVGHTVTCIDVDAQKIEDLKAARIPIYEPGLGDLVERTVSAGRLHFSTDPVPAIRDCEMLFIAVGTPADADSHADLRQVLAVAKTIGEHMDAPKIVVNKSTVPVGTAQRVREEIERQLEARSVAVDFDVCSNPEFLKEGTAIEDFTGGPRIIVGTDSERVRKAMRECYGPYNRQHDKLMFMNVRSAELTKYAANAMLATKISFINEIASLAERLGADIEDVRQGIGSDPRIGYHFIYPGCGYGGSCFPKDVQALARSAADVGYDAQLLAAVDAVNNRQKDQLFEKLAKEFDGDLDGRTIAVWGLSFKPNTDDIRDAPSVRLLEDLFSAGAKVRAYDPVAMNQIRRRFPEQKALSLVADGREAVDGSDALVICTEWKQFRVVEFDWLRETLKRPLIIDGRNLYDPVEVAEAGLRYLAVGRGDSLSRTVG